jgi:WD40 repeat protein
LRGPPQEAGYQKCAVYGGALSHTHKHARTHARTQLWSLKGHTYACYTMAVDKKRDLMVSGGGDALISCWDLKSVVCTRTYARMDGPVKDVSISHDGRWVTFGYFLVSVGFG